MKRGGFIVTAKSGKIRYEAKPQGLSARASQNTIALKENYFYTRVWAVSSMEKWGLNCNADGFTDDELRKAYKSFHHTDDDPCWVCLNHKADEEKDSIGENQSPIYTPEGYVEVIMGIDRARAAKLRPGLEEDIKAGRVTDTSMGCVADYSVCTACGNVAHDAVDYCDHLKLDKMGRKAMKGKVVAVVNPITGASFNVMVGELYFGVNFVENSIIDGGEGADLNAKIFEIAAARQTAEPNRDKMWYAMREIERKYGTSSLTRRIRASLEQK